MGATVKLSVLVVSLGHHGYCLCRVYSVSLSTSTKEGYDLPGISLSLSVCFSSSRITRKTVDQFWWIFILDGCGVRLARTKLNILTPKRHILDAKHTYWPILVLTCKRDKEPKKDKERNMWHTGYAPKPLTYWMLMKFCMWGVLCLFFWLTDYHIEHSHPKLAGVSEAYLDCFRRSQGCFRLSWS